MRLSPVAGEATLSVYVKLVAAMLSWGGTWVAGRVVAQAVTTPIAAAAARFTLAALVLGAVMLAKGEPMGADSWQRAWRSIVGLALTGVFFYNLCFFYGLKHVGAGRGALSFRAHNIVMSGPGKAHMESMKTSVLTYMKVKAREASSPTRDDELIAELETGRSKVCGLTAEMIEGQMKGPVGNAQ